MNLQLTKKEIYLAVFIGLMGFFLYSPPMIRWLDTLSPLAGDIFYEILFIIILYVGSNMGFLLYEPKKVPFTKALGLFLVGSALLMTINWESPYVNIVARGNADNLSNIYWQTDDGISWWFTTTQLKIDSSDCATNDYCKARIVAFSIIPFIIAIIGLLFIRGKVGI